MSPDEFAALEQAVDAVAATRFGPVPALLADAPVELIDSWSPDPSRHFAYFTSTIAHVSVIERASDAGDPTRLTVELGIDSPTGVDARTPDEVRAVALILLDAVDAYERLISAGIGVRS